MDWNFCGPADMDEAQSEEGRGDYRMPSRGRKAQWGRRAFEIVQSQGVAAQLAEPSFAARDLTWTDY